MHLCHVENVIRFTVYFVHMSCESVYTLTVSMSECIETSKSVMRLLRKQGENLNMTMSD